MSFPDLVGLLGVALLLGAYLLLQIGRLDQASIAFSLLNALGSVLILVSLAYHFNLAATIIEASWLLLSLLGLIRAFLRRPSRSNSD